MAANLRTTITCDYRGCDHSMMCATDISDAEREWVAAGGAMKSDATSTRVEFRHYCPEHKGLASCRSTAGESDA